MNGLIQKKNKHYTIPIFVPELACPNRCVFCNQYNISGFHNQPNDYEIVNTIEKYLKSFKKDSYKEIGFFGGNFTGIDIEVQIQYLLIANNYLQKGQIQNIRISTRPDYINQNIISLLKKYNVGTIELGTQSTNDIILNLSNRGHNFNQIKNSVKLIKQNGFKLGLQMMLGLPGDTLETSYQTAQDIVDFGADETRIYPCLVIEDTDLAKLYYNREYIPLSIEQAVLWTKHIYLFFLKNNINVLRIGLHPSEDILNGKSLIAGPFHVAFKELVETEIWWDILSKLNIIEIGTSFDIYVNSKNIQFAIGHSSKNKIKLQERYKVRFKINNDLKDYDYQVIYC